MESASSCISLSKMKLSTKPEGQEIIKLKIVLPSILEYLYVLNNTFTIDDIKKKKESPLTYHYSMSEQKDGQLVIETNDNNCFHIICAFMTTEEINFKIEELYFKQEAFFFDNEKMMAYKLNFAYNESNLNNRAIENITSALISYGESCFIGVSKSFEIDFNAIPLTNNVEKLEQTEDLIGFISHTHTNLLESYKTITYDELENEVSIETIYY
jgi:hypothetical protein